MTGNNNTSSLMPCAACGHDATEACSSCKLVKYCSETCKARHKSAHEPICKSPLLKTSWSPGWVRQNRSPAFVTSGGSSASAFHGRAHYLCGNTPAFDGLTYAGLRNLSSLAMLFAASGDLRNVIASLNAQDPAAVEKTEVIVNDLDAYVVIRNLFILILLSSASEKTGKHKEAVIDTVIHLWYSAFLTPAMAMRVRQMCSAAFEPACGQSPREVFKIQLTKTTTVDVLMPLVVWQLLYLLLEPNDELTYATAKRMRDEVAVAPSRVDFRERYLSHSPQEYRLSMQMFWDDGILLPAYASRAAFTVPNFTMFEPSTCEWLQLDSYNPLNSYFIPDMVAHNASLPAASQAPPADIFGIMHIYLHSILSKFITRLGRKRTGSKLTDGARGATGTLALTFTAFDARSFPLFFSFLPPTTPCRFDFIDVSNLTDMRTLYTGLGYLGVNGILNFVAKLYLKKPSGILLSGFMNIKDNLDTFFSKSISTMRNQFQEAALRRCMVWLPREMLMGMMVLGEQWKIMDMSSQFRDWEAEWKMYKDLEVDDMMWGLGFKIRRCKSPWKLDVALRAGRGKAEVLREASVLWLNGLGTQPYVVLWEYE